MTSGYATTIRDVNGNFVNVTNGNLDVLLGDQITPLGIMPLFSHRPNFTISAPATINTNILNAVGGHSINLNDVIILKDSGNIYNGVAVGVNENEITLDTPLFRTFEVATTIGECGTKNANVNGSVTPQIFYIGPPTNSKWDLTKITILIEDTSPMDTSLFGGINALTKGIVIRKKDGEYQPIFNWKTNGDIILTSSDYAFDAKAPSGVYSLNSEVHISGQANYGVVVRVDGDTDDKIELIVQDDLTGLSNLFVIVHGHMVV